MHAPLGSAQYLINGLIEGLLAPGNLDLTRRPTVHNPDGTISTVESTSYAIPGRGEVLIPRVVGDQVVSPHAALLRYLQTGENLGAFESPAAADRYANRLHRQQAAMYGH